MKSFLIALQLLTIVPVRVGGEVTERDMARSAAFLPLIGALLGTVAAAVAIAVRVTWSPEIAAAVVIILLVILTGGLHIDGLADTCDAFAVKSSGDPEADRERRLEVMKDSATGAIGAAGVVCVVVLKFALLSLVLKNDALRAAGIVFLMAVVSRWAPVVAAVHGTPARQDGLGKIFIGRIGFATLAAATIIACLAGIGSASWGGGLTLALRFGKGLGLVYLTVVLLSALFRRRFGGQTGDTLGATAEVSELVFLAVMTA